MRQGHDHVAAAGGSGHGGGNLPAIDVRRVVPGNRYVDGAGSLAGRNDNHRAVRQGHGQVGRRRLPDRGGVNDHATRFGDGRGGAEAEVGGDHRDCRAGGGIDAPGLLDGRRSVEADRGSGEADGRVHAAGRGVEHYEAVAAACRAATACRRRAGSRGFELCSRVDTGGDRLLQLFNRRGGLCGGLAQVSAAIRRIRAPLGVAAQVEQAAIGQFEGHRPAHPGEHLLACEQAIALDEYAPDAFWGYCDDLANNALDDRNNAAHWTLRLTR